MNTPQTPVYIVAGRRTPQLKARGRPGPFAASDLALHAAQALLNALALAPESLDEVILGCVSPAADEANIGRILALRLGCGERTPAWTVQRNCASGMQALDSAANDIRLGRADLVLAGGSEAMSRTPLLWNALLVNWLADWRTARGLRSHGRALARLRPAYLAPVIGLLKGLTDPVVGLNMGQTAEVLASRFDIRRDAMDRFALASHQKLAAALAAGRLADEITPLYGSDNQVYEQDDGLRADTDLAALSRLKPAFDRPDGRVTAGNSAQISDGAAVLLLASEAGVKRHQLPVLGELLDSQWAGLAPAQMGLGPVHAMAPLMQRNQLGSHDIAAWEINEAFAAQVLACLRAWQDPDYCQAELGCAPFEPIPDDELNSDGGGISLGHPVGASGARIVLHVLNRLRGRPGQLGMASLCIGGGQGGAMLVRAG